VRREVGALFRRPNCGGEVEVRSEERGAVPGECFKVFLFRFFGVIGDLRVEDFGLYSRGGLECL
jgi:hypothetical protein